MSGRIPLILVTGFLGSGKTTLLRRLANAHPESILRVKGQIETPEGFWTVEGTVDSLSLTKAETPGTDALVLITHDRDSAVLEEAVQEIHPTA